MRAERIWSALRSVLLALRTLTLLTMALVYQWVRAGAVFPRTRGLSRGMLRVRARPLEVIANGLIAQIPTLIFLVVLFFVFRLTLRVIRLFFDAVERARSRWRPSTRIGPSQTYKIVRAPRHRLRAHRGVSLHSWVGVCGVQGVSLFIGIVFSLGSSSAISNIIAGYMMTYRRAFKVGGLGEGRLRLRRRDRNASAGHASAFDEERRGRHPELAESSEAC
jgi:hypothetical protein